MNFYKRSYQPILPYLYTEAIKRRGEISLHRHFKQNQSIERNVIIAPEQTNFLP